MDQSDICLRASIASLAVDTRNLVAEELQKVLQAFIVSTPRTWGGSAPAGGFGMEVSSAGRRASSARPDQEWWLDGVFGVSTSNRFWSSASIMPEAPTKPCTASTCIS